MCKAILFDFDGVLTLDASGSTSICNYMARVMGIDKDRFKMAYKKYNKELAKGEVTHKEIWGDLCATIDMEIEFDVLKESFIHTPLDFDMLQLAVDLKNAGYLVGIITDNKRDRMDAITEKHDLTTYFDTITVSADIGSGKDEVHIFKHALSELGIRPEECLFIDNKKANLVIPSKMGIKTIFYDDELRQLTELKEMLRQIAKFSYLL